MSARAFHRPTARGSRRARRSAVWVAAAAGVLAVLPAGLGSERALAGVAHADSTSIAPARPAPKPVRLCLKDPRYCVLTPGTLSLAR
jgi:hypothetical protein